MSKAFQAKMAAKLKQEAWAKAQEELKAKAETDNTPAAAEPVAPEPVEPVAPVGRAVPLTVTHEEKLAALAFLKQELADKSGGVYIGRYLTRGYDSRSGNLLGDLSFAETPSNHSIVESVAKITKAIKENQVLAQVAEERELAYSLLACEMPEHRFQGFRATLRAQTAPESFNDKEKDRYGWAQIAIDRFVAKIKAAHQSQEAERG